MEGGIGQHQSTDGRIPSESAKRDERRSGPAGSGARYSQKPCLPASRSEEHTSELQSQSNPVCRLLLEKKKALRSTRSMSACRSIRSSTAWTSTRRSTASTGTIPSIRSIALGWCSSATGPILSPRPPDRRHARGSVGLAQDHARPDRVVRRLVDQDEAARRAVPAILVEEQGRGGAQRDPSDLVEAERFGVLVAVQLVHVERSEEHTSELQSQ